MVDPEGFFLWDEFQTKEPETTGRLNFRRLAEQPAQHWHRQVAATAGKAADPGISDWNRRYRKWRARRIGRLKAVSAPPVLLLIDDAVV